LIRVGSKLLAAAALFFLLRKPAARPGRVTPAALPRGTVGREVQMVRTGEPDLTTWARRRLALTQAAFTSLTPPLEGSKADAVALSLLAQWAHETNRGASEFNFNLGGWTARRGDTFHTAPDRLSSAAGFRWTAYPDLPTAIEDQIRRLVQTYPTAWGLLLSDPESDAWILELGRRGYYTAAPSDYSRAWRTQRADLGRRFA
jgi:hypothetical protein